MDENETFGKEVSKDDVECLTPVLPGTGLGGDRADMEGGAPAPP